MTDEPSAVELLEPSIRDCGLPVTRQKDGITFHADMPLLSSDATLLPRLRERTTRRTRSRISPRLRRLLVALMAFASLLASTLVHAAPWKPPPLRGHVVDEAGALTPEQARHLDRKLDRARRQTGFAIVVYLLPQLPDGKTMDDVGYEAGNAWGVGSKNGDDGVLLIASLGDRKVRFETGRGVGGALTDVQSSRINREIIGPLLKEGQTYEAMNRGVDAVLKELVENTAGGKSDPGRDPSASRRHGGSHQAQPATLTDYVKLGVVGLVILGVIVLAIISPTFRELLFWVLLFGRFGGRGGGGGRNDDDEGSGYSGGGGSFGGGGSTDDY
jgi:uncharacterized protein